MKKILISSILFFSLGAHAQIDSTNRRIDTSKIKLIEPPDSTGFGTPDGKLVGKEIGQAGGTIVSDDGRVELIFPEGALVANTDISIQPVTNMLNGSGKAYQFEPSGIQFKKPVKIIFHYNDEEAETCPPDLKSFALQDQKGKWTFFEYDEWDSSGKILTGFIHHFSALVADQSDVLLVPDDQNVHVNRRLIVSIMHRRLEYDASGHALGNEFAEFIDNDDEKGFGIYVNGIPKGNSAVGTAMIITLGISKMIRYIAPEYLPRKNPIEIKLTFKYYSRIKKKIRWGSSKCTVDVYDEYKITIVYNGRCGLRCGAELEDSSHFTVKFYTNKKPEITDVVNFEPKLTKQPDCSSESRGGRSANYTLTYDPAGCYGPVHVRSDRLTGYGVQTNDQTLTPPDITIEFAPNIVKIMNGKIHFPTTGGASTNSHFLKRQLHIPAEQPPDEPIHEEDVNVGNKIKFKANRQHQDLTMEGNGPYGYRLIIEPI